MKRLFLLVFLAACPAVYAQFGIGIAPVRPGAVAPDVPVVNPDPNFPLRVHLLTARFGGLGNVYHGYGSGNLVNDRAVLGFDYGFECDVPFVPNQSANETYQARWTRSQYGLEILMAEVGGQQPRQHTCTLRLATRKRPFEPANTAALSHGVSSSLRKRWQDPDSAYEETRMDYPLHFHVVDGQRTEDGAADHGWGTANLTDPVTQAGTIVQGTEFSYGCSYGFLTNSQLTSFYQARWTKPGSELEVLLQRPGSDKVDTCKVKVDLKPQAYPQSRHIVVGMQTSSAAAPVRPGQGAQ
jgi:hypothetical protein